MLLLLACTPAPSDTAAVDTAPATETAADTAEETEGTGLTAAQVEAAWAVYLVGPQSISARPVFRTFDAATEDRDADCPGGTDTTTALTFDADCTTASGTVYAGSASRSFPDGESFTESLTADLTVQTAEGVVWTGSGSALSQSSWSEEEGEVYTSVIDGFFHDTGPDAGDAFLSAETTMSLTQERRRPDEATRLLLLTGWIEDAVGRLTLSDLTVDQDLCAAGVLSIAVDGVETSLALSDCTGCGPLSVDGTATGESACVDLSPWMAWEG